MANKITVLNDEECETEKPEIEKSCELRPCEGVDWVTSSWSGVRIYFFLLLFCNGNLILYTSNSFFSAMIAIWTLKLDK